MKVITEHINLSTKGHTDIVDITKGINSKIQSQKLKNGIVTVSVPGSTASITTCEYEPGLVQDIKDFFQNIIPQNKNYSHDDTWHDGNGHAHLRASLLGPSLTTPFSDGVLMLGTWQQIILIDFDNRPRKRKIILQFIGD